jgi:type VI secretion system secreted protein VgrG
MPGYSQDTRPIRVTTTLGANALLLTRFAGYEGVSTPFSFQLDMVSENAAIDANAMLRTPVTVTLDLHDGQKRHFHGLINRFTQLGTEASALTGYRAEIVPWFWFLTLARDCRIFQKKNVIEIIETIFKDNGYQDFEVKASGLKKRDFCVQYRETNFNFISRLMEEEGLFYFFKHSDSKHTLVIADNKGAVTPGLISIARIGSAAKPTEDMIESVERDHSVYVGKVTLSEYDWQQPSLTLRTEATGTGKEEVHDYWPQLYTTPEDGHRYARLRLEAEEATQQTIRGHGHCRFLQGGYQFTLEGHYRGDFNKPYTLLEVHHTADVGDYRSDTGTFHYYNEFVAIPHALPPRPRLRTLKPYIRGTQTALVVGAAGEEIYVDKHGRIKVQFYWDREGKKDENSSCWVRVASPWAGKGWGNVTIPRIGNEVVVEFLDGDPDRPLIIGSVYNAEQAPPFTLPGAGIQMGMKSRSSKGGGGYNEITVTDTKGKELITIHGQYDMETTIEHDERIEVKNNQTITIGVDRTESVGANETISIGGDRSESVSKDESISIEGGRTETVGDDESVSIGKGRSVSVGKDDSLDVKDNHSVAVGKDQTLTVQGKRTTKIGKDDQLQVGKKLVIEAGEQIQLKTGDATITMKKDGTIDIKGKDISIQGSGKITVKASSDVVVKGSKVLSN